MRPPRQFPPKGEKSHRNQAVVGGGRGGGGDIILPRDHSTGPRDALISGINRCNDKKEKTRFKPGVSNPERIV
jgi:hypothetical protein